MQSSHHGIDESTMNRTRTHTARHNAWKRPTARRAPAAVKAENNTSCGRREHSRLIRAKIDIWPATIIRPYIHAATVPFLGHWRDRLG